MSEARSTPSHGDQPDPTADETGLYLYGIGLIDSDDRSSNVERLVDDAGLRIVSVEGLAAFVRDVPLSDFAEDTLQSRIQDQEWLMQAVQDHHQMISALSRELVLLPATFGTVYESDDSLLESMRNESERLRTRLERILGCDEWALHVYREEPGIREQLLEEDPELRRIRHELEDAPQGRAYLLKQQLERRLNRSIEEQQLAIADSVLSAVRDYAREIRVEEPRPASQTGQDVPELARASLLVSRDQSESFLEALNWIDGAKREVRIEVSGPWPAYSFAQTEPDEPS